MGGDKGVIRHMLIRLSATFSQNFLRSGWVIRLRTLVQMRRYQRPIVMNWQSGLEIVGKRWMMMHCVGPLWLPTSRMA